MENDTITFEISNGKSRILRLIKRHTKIGSLYYREDHTSYAVLLLPNIINNTNTI
ncbi:MAG TPA: hypothetical protein VK250_07600 [Nitrososphaeraceae archaeon]|nr:hypothetical protein [Nitrososphaeraceae archaeon]